MTAVLVVAGLVGFGMLMGRLLGGARCTTCEDGWITTRLPGGGYEWSRCPDCNALPVRNDLGRFVEYSTDALCSCPSWPVESDDECIVHAQGWRGES